MRDEKKRKRVAWNKGKKLSAEHAQAISRGKTGKKYKKTNIPCRRDSPRYWEMYYERVRKPKNERERAERKLQKERAEKLKAYQRQAQEIRAESLRDSYDRRKLQRAHALNGRGPVEKETNDQDKERAGSR